MEHDIRTINLEDGFAQEIRVERSMCNVAFNNTNETLQVRSNNDIEDIYIDRAIYLLNTDDLFERNLMQK